MAKTKAPRGDPDKKFLHDIVKQIKQIEDRLAERGLPLPDRRNLQGVWNLERKQCCVRYLTECRDALNKANREAEKPKRRAAEKATRLITQQSAQPSQDPSGNWGPS
eukprot:1725284-Rhodomonas_salina.1